MHKIHLKICESKRNDKENPEYFELNFSENTTLEFGGGIKLSNAEKKV